MVLWSIDFHRSRGISGRGASRDGEMTGGSKGERERERLEIGRKGTEGREKREIKTPAKDIGPGLFCACACFFGTRTLSLLEGFYIIGSPTSTYNLETDRIQETYNRRCRSPPSPLPTTGQLEHDRIKKPKPALRLQWSD